MFFRSYFEQWKRASPVGFKGDSDERHDLKGDVKETGDNWQAWWLEEVLLGRQSGNKQRDRSCGLHRVSGFYSAWANTFPGNSFSVIKTQLQCPLLWEAFLGSQVELR